MGPKFFKFPSKCLLISWICCFSPVRTMWGFLVTSRAPITDNDNLAINDFFPGVY